MVATERLMAQANQRARRLLDEAGREIRRVRVTRGLSQAVVAAAAQISQAQVSLVEHGRNPGVAIGTLSRLSSAVGLELSIRLYPAGPPIRDRAHVALLDRFRAACGGGWDWAAEVPLPIPGDRRAWDRVIRRPGLVIGVEAETRPTDAQELARRVALKKRDGGMDRVILVLADTEWCRRFSRLNDLEASFPVAGRITLRALSDGRDPGGDAIILV